MQSTLTTKGQVTIPKEAREHLRLKPGDRVKFFILPDGRVVILPVLSALELKGILPARGKRASLADIDETIAKGAVARFKGSSKR